MTEVDAFLANCRLADGRLIDIGISGGRIAVVGEGAASRSNSAPALDIGGDLVLPGLVDGHMHLDKTLTGLPWMGHAAGPTRVSRIETDKTILPHLPLSTEDALSFAHDFANGYPTKETVEKLYDERDFQRACQAYLWALPIPFHR